GATRAGLGRGECRGPAARDRRRVRAGPAAAAPVVAVVPVEVRPDRGRARRRLAVLAPVVAPAARGVELRTVRVDDEHDPDLTRVDDRGDPGVVAVTVDQPVED